MDATIDQEETSQQHVGIDTFQGYTFTHGHRMRQGHRNTFVIDPGCQLFNYADENRSYVTSPNVFVPVHVVIYE